MTDLAEQIRQELAMAQALDLAAREHRKQAGRMLALAREQETGSGWYIAAGISDESSARLLIQLAAGGVPYEFER